MLTDPTAQYLTGSLVGRLLSTTSGSNLQTNVVILANTLTTLTVAVWAGGTPSSGAAYTVTGTNSYTANSYLPVTGCSIEPDPGLFSPAVMMAQRDKNIFALYGQYKFAGGIDAPIFPTNGMAILAGSIGNDVNQYGSLPATTAFGYITATANAGATTFTFNYAGLAANSVFPIVAANFLTLGVGALGVAQYGSNANTFTSSTNTTFTATTAVDSSIVTPWYTNQWAGRVVTSGINAATVISNTATTLTTTTWRANTGGAGTPSAAATFSIQANFTAQANNQSFVITPSQISTITGGAGAPYVVTLKSTGGATNGALPQAITLGQTGSASTTITASLVTDTAWPVAVASNAYVGKVITSQTFAGVVTANSAATAGGTITIDVGGGWFTGTTGASGGPPANGSTVTVSGNNVVQAVTTPYFHSIVQSNSLLPSFTIEKSLGGGDTVHNAESEQYVGIRIGKYTCKLGATNTEAQFTADVTGRNGVVLASPSVPTYTNENPFVFAECYVTLFGNNVMQAQDIEINIDNGLKQTYTFDQTHQLSYNTPVVRNITGKITVVHDNLDDASFGYFNSLLQYGSQTVQGSLSMTLVHPATGAFLPGNSPSEQVQISLSAVNLSKYADDMKLEDVIMTSLDYTAFLNLGVTPPTTIGAVIANQQAFAY